MAQIQKKDSTDERTQSFIFPADDVEDLICQVNDLPPISGLRLILHGIRDKVGDAYSGCAKDYAAGRASAEKVWQQLLAGEWTAKRTGVKTVPTLFAEAIQRVFRKQGKDRTIDEVKAFINRQTDEGKVALRARGDVKRFIQEIRDERLAAELANAKEDAPLED